jgi:hypothetical protein
MDYAIATFCYGERYYNQTNRLIESFDVLENCPDIFVVTDSPESIIKRQHVKVKNISEYNERYNNYEKNYYDFDFSVKRFSVLFAFENGYNNVILTDTDAVLNQNLYTHESIINCFVNNSIQGQVTYNFNNEYKTNSRLGRRFLVYENEFNVEYDKKTLDFMPEDCVQYISINNDLKFKFIDTWGKCIEIKDSKKLHNIPAGNIDEMCFSALYHNMTVGNNSNISINKLIPHHDKWY